MSAVIEEPVTDEIKDLVAVERLDIPAVFAGDALEPLLASIEERARSVVTDLSTEKGRNECRSRAYRIARCKTFLDDAGKDFVADLKEKAKGVDEKRRTVRDRLDALRDEIREPLTEWEDERKRADEYIGKVNGLATSPVPRAAAELELLIDELVGTDATTFCEDKRFQVKAAVGSTLAALRAQLEERREFEALKRKEEERQLVEEAYAENERRDREAKEQAEREERIRQEAAETARREAEEKASRERAEAARAFAEQQQAAEASRKKINELHAVPNQEHLTSSRAIAIEIERIDGIEAQYIVEELREEFESVRATVRARLVTMRDEHIARERAEKERRDQEEARRQEEAEAARRAADQEHRRHVNNEAVDALIEGALLTRDGARKIVELIARGEVPHVSITY